MTYQVAFRGRDGMVIASDTREYLEGGGKRKIRKIQTDPSGRFAWAFAGRQFSSLVASSLHKDFTAGLLASHTDVDKAIRELSTKLLPDSAYNENPRSTILWIDGSDKKAYRTELLPKDLSISTEGQMWTAGYTSQLASLIPEHFFDESMTADQLAVMAAYTVWLANKIEPTLVDGLDIAIYRDSKPHFEFLNSVEYLEKAKQFDRKIRNIFSI